MWFSLISYKNSNNFSYINVVDGVIQINDDYSLTYISGAVYLKSKLIRKRNFEYGVVIILLLKTTCLFKVVSYSSGCWHETKLFYCYTEHSRPKGDLTGPRTYFPSLWAFEITSRQWSMIVLFSPLENYHYNFHIDHDGVMTFHRYIKCEN